MAHYRPITSEQFAEACDEQGVRLCRSLDELADEYPDQPARKLVRQAGVTLRHGPGIRLADRLISSPVYPDDNVSSILQRVINSSIEPVGRQPGVPYYSRQSFNAPNTCEAVEAAFGLTLQEIRRGNLTDRELSFGGEIYVDEDSRAVALRKHLGYSSALSLTDFNFGGVVVPVGSDMLLETAYAGCAQGYELLDGSRFVIRSIREVVAASFGRLTALASQPEQRQFASTTSREAGPEAFALLQTMRVEELQPHVQTAVDALRG